MKKIFVVFPYGDTILKTKENNVEKRLEKYKDLIEENYIFGKHVKKQLDEISNKSLPMDSFSIPSESLKDNEYIYLKVNFWTGEIEFVDERGFICEKVENKLPGIKKIFKELREELIEKLPILAVKCINELDGIKSKYKRQDEIRKEVEELLKDFPMEEIKEIDLVDDYEKFVKNNEEYFEKLFDVIPRDEIEVREKSYGIMITRICYRFDFTVKSDNSVSVYNKTRNKVLFNTEDEKEKWMEEFKNDESDSLWWNTAWENYKNNAGY